MPQNTEKGATGFNDLTAVGRLRPGTIRVSVKREIKSDELHAALDRILDLHGCPTCGLNGLDVLFRHFQPINEAFREFKNISNVEQFNY